MCFWSWLSILSVHSVCQKKKGCNWNPSSFQLSATDTIFLLIHCSLWTGLIFILHIFLLWLLLLETTEKRIPVAGAFQPRDLADLIAQRILLSEEQLAPSSLTLHYLVWDFSRWFKTNNHQLLKPRELNLIIFFFSVCLAICIIN